MSHYFFHLRTTEAVKRDDEGISPRQILLCLRSRRVI